MLVFAASVWYIGRTFQWRDLGQVLKTVNLTCLIAGGGTSIVVYWLLRTLRWHILLRQTGTRVPLFDLHMCTAVSRSFALFTPFQSEEMLKIELLKKHGLIQRSPGYGTFLIERVLDLAALLAMACVSLLTTVNLATADALRLHGGHRAGGIAGVASLLAGGHCHGSLPSWVVKIGTGSSESLQAPRVMEKP